MKRQDSKLKPRLKLLPKRKHVSKLKPEPRFVADSTAKAEEAARISQIEAAKQLALREAEEKRKREIEAQKEALAKASQPVRDTSKSSPTASNTLPTIDKDYPEGISDETITENNRTIYRTVIKRAASQDVFSKVVYNWGGVFYFKGNASVTEANFNSELKRAKELLQNK
jgi:hypothetical protein